MLEAGVEKAEDGHRGGEVEMCRHEDDGEYHRWRSTEYNQVDQTAGPLQEAGWTREMLMADEGNGGQR